jgi:type VI secretion system protein ImpG
VTAPASEEFLRYYLEELTYLRHMGERFARSYPKVAARLELQRDECPDPHVERLIESFAFLTARIQSDLDADFPEIAAELLGVLYPHYLNPVPSMAVARFDFDPDRGKLTTGKVIPRHTPLFSVAEQGQVCRFRTAYSVTLWPIEVTEAELEPAEPYDLRGSQANVAHVLRLRLESRADPFDVMGVDSLRFFLSGEAILISRLFELLHESVRDVAVLPVGETSPRFLGDRAIGMVGFDEEEAVVPYPRQSHPAYRLLQEYFIFPEKFHFIDVRGLLGRASGQAVDLLFLLDRVPRRKLLLTPQTFALGCTPVANLFRKTSEPIRVDHRQIEYRLAPDMRKERTTEIHSVLSVSGTSDPIDPTRDYAPFYSFSHAMELRQQKAFWHARRVPTLRDDMTGTELLLSFRDLEFRPTRPPDEVVFAQLLCTNRALAEQLPADAVLQSDEPLPVARIVALKKPTRAVTPPLGGQDLWRLVSHLSLNYLSITSGAEGLQALREILGLYCFSDAPSQRQQISGLQSLAYRPIVRRIGKDGWKGFCRGTEVAVEFDEAQYVGSSSFLLGAVLHRFFGLYASTNSFTQLIVRRTGREGEWKWPPMAGGKIVL